MRFNVGPRREILNPLPPPTAPAGHEVHCESFCIFFSCDPTPRRAMNRLVSKCVGDVECKSKSDGNRNKAPESMNADVEFSIRFAGIQYQFYCQPATSPQRAIRKARALSIRGTVITAQPGQHWELNRQNTHWTYCAATRVGPVPVAAVHWVMSDARKTIQTIQNGETRHWNIIKSVCYCYKCDSPCKLTSYYWPTYMGRGVDFGTSEKGKLIFVTPVCPTCISRFVLLCGNGVRDSAPYKFLSRPEIDYLASQDRSANVRWVRKFLAAGKFTPREFSNLCSEYGNICLRCGKCRPLVADHVIPIARGGANDITNIQPLCARCNGIKSDKSTDYRKRRRKASA
jgi:5-methylcytosine-specific restriction endonuclease McrA